MKKITYSALMLIGWVLAAALPAFAQSEIFNYKQVITRNARTLNVRINTINRSSGEVEFGGGDSRGPTTPGLTFTWIWGDGTSNPGFFPQKKTYTDISKNYLVKVVANYSATEKDTMEVLVDFVKGRITPVALDPRLKVYIPDQPFAVDGIMRTPFPDRIFDPESRAQLEYLLQVCSEIEYDFVNGNVRLQNGKFEQYMYRDSLFPGAYALSGSIPIAFGAGDVLTKGNVDYSSMCHEMGHNYTLNTPADYILNGRLEGRASPFYGEAIAQIFQQAAGYELINNYQKYGIDGALLAKLKANFLVNARFQRASFLEYIKLGMPFSTWSKVPGYSYTDSKEAFLTFIVVAYKFMETAEQQGKGFRIPMKRMMQFLQRFDSEWVRRYDPQNDTPVASSFRATLWAAAMSHAFQRDLRGDFRAINFPISDSEWAFFNPQILDVSLKELTITVAANSTSSFDITSNLAWSLTSSQPWLTANVSSGNGNKTVPLTASANTAQSPRTATVTVSATGLESRTVTVTQAGVAPALTVSTNALTINAAGSDKPTVGVVSNSSWTAISSQPWLSVSPASGSGNMSVTLTASANTSVTPRNALITFSANGTESKSVTVSQAGATTFVNVSTTTLSLAFTEGSTATFDIASNTSWTIASSQPWLTVAPASGSDNSKVTVTATLNALPDTRKAVVMVRASGVADKTVEVSQAASPITSISALVDNRIRVFPNPAHDWLKVDGLLANSQISLYGLSGKVVKESSSYLPETTINIQDLPNGFYLILVRQEGYYSFFKVFKAN